jgi:hypothetical protein
VSVLAPVIALRNAGLKPRAVFLDLVAAKFRKQPTITEGGVVTCQIVPDQSLADIDCRPLVGLTVHVQDFTGSRDRHRALARLVAAAGPALLVMPVLANDGGLTLHKRFANGETTTDRTPA